MNIYIGTNRINAKQYVGKSIHSLYGHRSRIKDHIRGDFDTHISRAIAKHGVDNFTWEVIEYSGASDKALDAIEQWYIAKLNTMSPNGYNHTSGGDGGRHSEESRRKMSLNNVGMTGKTHTTETRKKMSESAKGKKHTAETRKKMSESAKKRPPMSLSTRRKISEINTGKKRSSNFRNKMSEIRRGITDDQRRFF